jgi:hypothetical protein
MSPVTGEFAGKPGDETESTRHSQEGDIVAPNVNTPPPKGGGFGLRLEAGLIDPSGRFAQTTLKLSSGSSGL